MYKVIRIVISKYLDARVDTPVDIPEEYEPFFVSDAWNDQLFIWCRKEI